MSNIATDNPLSPEETNTLAILVSMVIPPSEKYQIPGADDSTILADILSTARNQVELIERGLQAINKHSSDSHDAAFTDLDHDTRMAIVDEFRRDEPGFMGVIASLTVQCYYRDARVMESLGMEARPPFPEGFELEQGDWSLLDPVRDRGKIWRDAN
jgi:hypothetical protein